MFHGNLHDFSRLSALLPITQPKTSGQGLLELGSMGVCGQRLSFLLLNVRLLLVVLARLHTGDTGELQLGFHDVFHHTGRCLHPLVVACTAYVCAIQRM